VIYPDTFYPWLLIYDGASDNTLKFSYWLVKKENASKSGGGCSTGFSAAGGIVGWMIFSLLSRTVPAVKNSRR
jgi:hypothetical protein